MNQTPDEKGKNTNENNKGEDPNDLKKTIEHILGAKVSLRRRKKTSEDVERERFIEIVNSLEKVYARSCLTGELLLDTSRYDETFYQIIDKLLEIHYGKEVAEIINFYLYERVDVEGKVQKIYDDEKNEIILENASDLYNLIKRYGYEKKK